MKLPFLKKYDDAAPEQWLAELEVCRERSELLLRSTVTLLSCVKEFAFGLTEIDAEAFSAEMEALKQHLLAAQTPAVLRRQFEGKPERIAAFIEREKAYLDEREQEYKTIVTMLRQGMAVLFDDNQSFNQSIIDQNLRTEQIIYLDDLRRVKEQLREQVEAIRTTVAEKRASDLRKMETLSREVDALRSSLERATDMSNTDALTGAHNRLAFDLNLQRMIDRFSIAKNRFALLLCDLDNFKLINDHHGHPIGDRVLKSFVMECAAFFRDQDFVARYGGEEFAILLPGATLRDARKRATLFCQKLAGMRYRIYEEHPDRTLAFTASVGVSEIRRDDTADTLIQRADLALYLAKRNGKNCVMSEQDVAREEKKRKPAMGE
jgi:diguanylate cyclase